MKEEIRSYEDVSLFDVLEENVYIVETGTLRLLFMNQKARNVYGVEGDDYIGMTCHHVLRDRNVPCPGCPLRANPDALAVREAYNPQLDRYFKVLGKSIRYRGTLAQVQLCVDITDFVRQRQDLQATLSAEAVLNETMQVVYTEPDLDKALAMMLEHIGLFLKAERCFLLSMEGSTMRMTTEWCSPGTPPRKAECTAEPRDAIERWFGIFSRHGNVVIPDRQLLKLAHPMEYEVLQRHDIRNCVAAPIIIRDEIVSVLAIANLDTSKMDGASLMLTTLSYFIATSMVADNNRKLLEKASYSDAMTGVANRNAFIRDIDQNQRLIDQGELAVGVIYFDLNGLKEINDSKGHRAGDRLIMHLADAITLFFRKREVYRTGGDEFIAICLNIPEQLFTERLARVMDYIDSSTTLSVSIGYAWSQKKGLSLQQVIATADSKMYEEKQLYYADNRRHSR